jgi:hypothetical protein
MRVRDAGRSSSPPKALGDGSRLFDGVVLDALGVTKWTPGREAGTL